MNGNSAQLGGKNLSASVSSKGSIQAKLPRVDNETCNDDETDDEYCVYTYKGDSRAAADLPSSFFTFDQGDSLSSADESYVASALPQSRRRSRYNGRDNFSPASSSTATTHQASNGSVVTFSGNGVNGASQGPPPPGDLFSPDMDFLEMDFDPGGFCDDEDEDECRSDGENGVTDAGVKQKMWNFVRGEEIVLPTDNSSYLSSQYCREADVTDGPQNATLVPKAGSQSTKPDDKAQACPVSRVLLREALNNTPNSSSLEVDRLSARVPEIPNSPLPLESHGSSKNVVNHYEPGCSHLNPQLLIGPREPPGLGLTRTPSRQLMMRLVKSSTLPEIRSRSIQDISGNRAKDEVIIREGDSGITRNQCLSYSDPLIKNETCYRAVINPSPKSTTEDDSIEFEVGGVMIWSEEEARQRSLDQIGTSACGATAVCNVLKALGFEHIDPAYVNSCVKTRLRNNEADIPEYLFSRSIAGATHEDLLQGTIKVSNGLVNGKFFQPKPGIEPRSFCKWLLHWICKGAVPVVTRNMQVVRSDQAGQQIPDAWHHQMIFGISPDKIFLTNPVEREAPSAILPQLTSPSVLLVRRSDVIDRKTPTTDLRKITKHKNPEWNELNVLGQVANILLEEIPVFSSKSIAKRIRTTHIRIPAGYNGGITLFMPSNSPFFSLLLEAPDL